MYNSNEETYWSSQTLMSHQDKEYQSDGYLRVTYSTRTKDFKNYNSTTFGISISNQRTKVVNLNIQKAEELLNSFSTIISNVEQITNEEIVLKVYQTQLIFKFVKETNNNQLLVKITIMNNETDFTLVIIHFNLFVVFAKRLKNFVNNYDNICLSMKLNFLQEDILSTNKLVLSAIKTLPSNFPNFENGIVSKIEDEEEVSVAAHVIETTINDLDTFLGEDMKNINLSELEILDNEQPSKNNEEIQSEFIKKVLLNDLSKFTSSLISASTSTNPVKYIEDILYQNLSLPDNFVLLPNIPEHELKSLYYLSKFLHNVMLRSTIPASTPVLKCHIKDVTQIHVDLAIDLLIIQAYLKNYRNKIETITSDIGLTKADEYLSARCFTDTFVYSVFEHKNIDKLKSVILSKYKLYSKQNIFANYDKILQGYNLSVTENDIANFIDQVHTKIVGKTEFIIEFHDLLFKNKSVKLPSINNFSLEQIINYFISIEIKEKFGAKFEKVDDFEQDTPKDIIQFFIQGKNPKGNQSVQPKQEEFISNLHRFVIKEASTEIPSNIRDQFIEYIKQLGNDNFDLSQTQFDLQTFGERLIKALYLWNPKENEKLANNWKFFLESVELETMTKDLIIAKLKNEDKNESGDWDNMFSDMKF